MTNGIPTRQELDSAYEEVVRIHREHLERLGVRLPPKTSYKWVWLAMLYHRLGERVHKNEISEATRLVFPNAAPDQQVRHLVRDGWNVENIGNGYHRLNDPRRPSATFTTDRTRRQGRLSAQSFDELKAVYGNRCASCGSAEGEVNPRYGEGAVQLQQGHKDPHGRADDMENIIPQCQFCNRAYRGDFVFDDKGRVQAVADVRPVRRASESVQRKIWNYLKNKFQNGKS